MNFKVSSFAAVSLLLQGCGSRACYQAVSSYSQNPGTLAQARVVDEIGDQTYIGQCVDTVNQFRNEGRADMYYKQGREGRVLADDDLHAALNACELNAKFDAVQREAKETMRRNSQR